MLYLLATSQSNFDRQWSTDSNTRHKLTLHRCFTLDFQKKHAVGTVYFPLNDVVLCFKIGLEMTMQRSFEVDTLIETAINGLIKSVPAGFGGHFLLLQ